MSKEIKYENGEIKIDIYYIFSSMSEDDQKSFIHALSLEKNIIENVCDYLAGDDQNGCWSGYDDKWRLRALRRIENRQLEHWSRYNWDVFREATHRLREIREKQHIYWALNHGPFKDDLWFEWMKFCEKNGIKSDYTTEKANADIDRVEAIMKDALSKLVQPTDQNAKGDG